MLEKALNQNEPKKIGEFFLSGKEKNLLKRMISRYCDSFEVESLLNPELIIKEAINIAKKIGLDPDFINELKSKMY